LRGSYKQFFPGDESSIDYVAADPDGSLQRLKFGEVDFVSPAAFARILSSRVRCSLPLCLALRS
jgi:hypothetical protein